MDNEIIINLGQTSVKGFWVEPDGTVRDFEGTLKNKYRSLDSASRAARRKYAQPSITITEMKFENNRYKVMQSELMKIATKLEE